MMKLRSALVAFAALTLLGVVGSASAQQPPQVGPAAATTLRPGVAVPFLSTRVTGVIRTNGTTPGEASLNGYNCDDLDIIVTSKESNPAPAGGFAAPKWVRTRHAVGTWSSGQCTFSVPVVANAEFNVYVSAGIKDYPCQYVTNLTVAPGYSPWVKVAFGKSLALADFSLGPANGKFYCGVIH